MNGNRIFYSEADDKMVAAFQKAQETFKYFWRELSWEHHRIVPGLDMACVKIAFTEETDDPDAPLVEHMWINEIAFDGDQISGELINDPDNLSNVEKGDFVQVPLTQLSDWLFITRDKTYGGFTIQLLRSGMTGQERREHDEAWGLNFGDPNKILIAYQQAEHPEHLVEHPMSVNSGPGLEEFIKANPGELTSIDEKGYTLLHRETIAGNKTSVEILVRAGADKHAKTQTGKSALDFARQLNWEHIIPVLEN